MNRQTAVVFLCLCGIVFLIGSSEADDSGGKSELKEKTIYSIENVENGLELLASVRGIESPLCLQLEGTRDETVRVLQDPQSGIIANAQLFHNVNNQTFIGAILIAQDSILVLVTQLDLMINNARFNWGEVRTLSIDGHEVIIRENVVELTFRNSQNTLLVQRSITNKDNSMDYTDAGKDSHNRSDTEGKIATKVENWSDVVPIVGYEVGESVLNQFLSSKRRRSLLLQKFFGINHDRAVVRNVVIELDTQAGFKKRASDKDKSNDSFNDASDSEQDTAHHQLQKGQTGEQTDDNVDDTHHRRRRLVPGRQERGYNSGIHTMSDDENWRDKNIFFSIFVTNAKDFSNKTHGLLGQFLFKNVTMEKIRYKGGQTKARLLVHGNPDRRTVALFTPRKSIATNVSRSCWKIRQMGRDVLDGRFADYIVPNIWYSNLKELPPPAPL